MATNTPLCSWGCSFPPWAARARAVLVLVNQAPSQATARALHPVCKGLEGQWISQAPSKANSLPGVRAFRSSNVLCYSPEQISRLLFFHLLSCLPFVKSTRTLSHWQKEERLRCIAVSCNKLHWLVFSLFLPTPFASHTIDFGTKHAITIHSRCHSRDWTTQGKKVWVKHYDLFDSTPAAPIISLSLGRHQARVSLAWEP